MLLKSARKFLSTSAPQKQASSLMTNPMVLGGGAVAAAGLGYFLLGGGQRSLSSNQPKTAAAPVESKNALDPKEFLPFKLVARRDLNHNTAIFEFAFPSPNDTLGLNVASCLLTKAEIEVADKKTGTKEVNDIVRPYTPISTIDRKGTVELLIKKYPDGVMTNYMFSMKPGDSLLFKGPIDKISYQPNKFSHVGMIAGGSGITPMYQVLLHALRDPSDKTKFTLLFANVSPDDILLKKELDDMAAKHGDRFKVFYTVDKTPSKEWKGFTGYVSADMVKKCNMPPSSDAQAMMFVCGNLPMLKSVCGTKAPDYSQGDIAPGSILDKLGFKKDNVFKF